MAFDPKRQVRFWGIGLLLFVALMWLLGGTLIPYFAGMAIAYLLDPLADRLERLGLRRVWVALIILVGAGLLFVLMILLAVPALVAQVQGLVEAMPVYIEQAQVWLTSRFPELVGDESSIRRQLTSMQETIQSGGMVAINAVLASSLAVIDYVTILAITPVVAFYLLLDWDHMIAKANDWLPRQHAPVIRDLVRQMDVVLAGFVRGQLSVCLILGAYYALALWAVQLPFGFLVGLLAGLISFIPFVGAFLGGVVSIGIALVTFWGEPWWIVAVAAIFALGQFVEGNILQPNLVGKSVGLHPVWLIFALSVFGALFGFAGLLIAVPVAAALGVVGRFALERYMASPLYTGAGGQPGPD